MINGDPFTDSQEYPSGFTLGTVLRAGSRATVPVRFDEKGCYKVVEYWLQLSGTTWRVDDLHYPDGATFRWLLKPAKGSLRVACGYAGHGTRRLCGVSALWSNCLSRTKISSSFGVPPS